MVTGKNKIKFEEFIPTSMDIGNWEKDSVVEWFYTLDEKLQQGVYIAYYDSLNVDTGANKYVSRELESGFMWFAGYGSEIERGFADSRPEAYREAFKKADELVNKSNNNN